MGNDYGKTLEGDILWSVLHAFPALVIEGPPPTDLVELVLSGGLSSQRDGRSKPPAGRWNLEIDT